MHFHCRGHVAIFGLDNLDTDECVPPCQIRLIANTTLAPGYDSGTLINDVALATFYPPLEYSREVIFHYNLCNFLQSRNNKWCMYVLLRVHRLSKIL